MRLLLVSLGLVGAVAVGCGDSDGGEAGDGGDAGGGGAAGDHTPDVFADGTYIDEDGVCRGGDGTLASYCRDGVCGRYEEAVAAANAAEHGALACDRGGTVVRWNSSLGTCGDLRWVRLDEFLPDFHFEYFDARGQMVSAEYFTDCDCFCGGASFSRYYGPFQTCERVTTDEPCDPSLELAGRSPIECVEPENSTIYVDETLGLDDWEVETIITGNGTEADYAHIRERVETAGDPDGYLSMLTRIDTTRCAEAPCGYEIEAVYRRRGWEYDPGENGAILHIHYSEVARLQGSFVDTRPAETFSGLVIFQENAEGEKVRHDLRFKGSFLITSWQDRGGCNLVLDDFEVPRPDFEGGPISFGIVRRTRLDTPGLVIDSPQGLDTFRVTVVPRVALER